MARQKKNRKAIREARKQQQVEQREAKRQARKQREAKRQARKQQRAEQREAKRQARKQQRAEQREAKRQARKYSNELKQRDAILYEREQKAVAAFFGHEPNARELNTWRGLVNSGAIDRIRELNYINYEPEAVKDATTNLLKSDLSSEEIINALEGYIKDYSVKEQSLYDYVFEKYGEIIPK